MNTDGMLERLLFVLCLFVIAISLTGGVILLASLFEVSVGLGCLLMFAAIGAGLYVLGLFEDGGGA